MRLYVSGWTAFLVALLWATAAGAQSSGQLAGSVTDVTGAPLGEVTVTIRGPETRVTLTGLDGRFDFPRLAAGEYELIAALTGFQPTTRRVPLKPGERAVLSLVLSVLLQERTVVTAARTGERDVQTTPMAVSVLSGKQLESAEAYTVAHLAGIAPSVTFSQNSDFAQLTIRGIGSNVVFAGSDPSSAMYVDGVYIARPVMVLADMLELERAELLRGPQGTLYGRNAVGGALNLITKPPTNEVDASARLVAGNLRALRADARLSGPIVRNRVLGSVAVLRGIRDGFVNDLDHPKHPLGGDDVTALRGKVHLVLNRRSDVLVSGDISHQDPTPLTYAKVLAVKPGFEIDNPADLRDVRASTLAEGRILQHGSSVRYTVRGPASTTLTSLTAFRGLEYDIVNDADISELDLTAVHLRERQHQWSEEITVSQQRSRLTWIGGLFFFGEDDHQPTVITLGGPRLQNVLDPEVDADTGAAFGQATIAITQRLSATAGLRYSSERKTIVNAGRLVTLDAPFSITPGTPYAYEDAIEHAAWMPKFALDFRPREGLLAYISATRGFKSGGFNFTSTVAGRGYAPEWVWSYEGGVKTRLPSGRATINLAGFQMDYSDLQVQTALSPGVIDISNAAEATIRGVEVESTTQLGPAWMAGGHFAWLDATYDRYIAVGVGGITGEVAGRRLNNAPEWSGRLWLQWNGDIGGAGRVSMRADSTWQSAVFFTPFNDAIQWQRPYGLLNASVDFEPAGRRWSVGVWARNLTDTDYITGSFGTPLPAFGGRPGLPFQAGVQMTIER